MSYFRSRRFPANVAIATAAALFATGLGASGCAHRGGAGPSAGGSSELVAGGGAGGDGGRATEARLIEPFGVARAPNGDLYIVEAVGHRIRRVDTAGIIHTVAGTGEKGDGGDGGPGPAAKLGEPHHILLSPRVAPGRHFLYVADTRNNRVRAVDSQDGTIRTVAGTGQKGFFGDGGPALQAMAGSVFCLAFNPTGDRLYFADLDNKRIRVVDLGTGIIDTVAGNGEKGVPTDGADARSAPLFDPRAIDVDSRGNLYIAERGGHALRVVDPAGKIRTVAGTGEKGYSGDGGPARAAMMNGPKHLTVDRDDTVLIVDTENHVIRRYDPRDGRITLVAGTGKAGPGGLGGPPDRLELDRPHGVYVERDGSLLLSDSDNHRVVRVRLPKS